MERSTVDLTAPTVPAPDGFVYETETVAGREGWRPPILDRPGVDTDRMPRWVHDQGWPALPGVRAGPSVDGYTAYIHPRGEDGFCIVLVDGSNETFTPACATFAEHVNQGRLEARALAEAYDDDRSIFAGLMLPDALGISHPNLRADESLDVTIVDDVFLAIGPRPNMAPEIDYRWEPDRARLIRACNQLVDQRDATVIDSDGEPVTATECIESRVPPWVKVYTQGVWQRFGRTDPPVTVDVADYGTVQTLAATASTTDVPRPPFLSRIARAEVVEAEVAVFWWFESNDGAPLWCIHAIDRAGLEASRCISDIRSGVLRVALDQDRVVQVVTGNYDTAFFTVAVAPVDAVNGGEATVVAEITNQRRPGVVVIPPGPVTVTRYGPDGAITAMFDIDDAG